MSGRALLLAAAAILSGCASSASAPQIVIKVNAPRTVNGGRPMQMLVRNVDGATFSSESYPAAAAKVVTPDPSVLRSEVIYPGANLSISLAKPDKGDLAVYFFFLTPGPEWKVLLPPPFDSSVRIQLGSDRVQAR